MARKKPEKSDPGGETRADTRLVNGLESAPGFFKDPMVGRTLGKCKISKLLGEGKTAVVYRATYQPLKRTVAVKVLQEHMKKVPAVVRVFQQEGRAVAAMDHQNILKIYDVGEDQGRHYLVLELLEGCDLLRIIEESENLRLPLPEALEYVRQAARGLAAAHRKNLVHRDIKPQNMVVEPDGTLKIVDFGLAAEAEGAFAGGRLGTPHYMSPEICKGEKAQTASDIYALGITFFHMVVGHPPYSGRHTTEEIVAEHLKGERLQPEKIRRDIPRKVGDLIRQMTRMDPGARPTARQVLEALDRLTPDKLAGARRVAARSRTVRAGARRQQSVAGGAVVAGGVTVLALVVFLMMRNGGDEAPAPKKEVEPVAPPVERVERNRIDPALAREIRDLMAEAGRHAGEGNYQLAHAEYQKVILKAPAGSPPYEAARTAARELQTRIDKTRRKPPSPARVIGRDSRSAGREFERRKTQFREMMRRLEIQSVKGALRDLLDRTQKRSPEYYDIELAIQRLGYLESLLGVAGGRAHALETGKDRWSYYDLSASGGLVIMGARPEGIEIEDERTGKESVLAWGSIDTSILIKFFDQIRNATSATESLWLGYFCHLVQDPRADTYLDLALQLDASTEMRDEVRAIRGK